MLPSFLASAVAALVFAAGCGGRAAYKGGDAALSNNVTVCSSAQDCNALSTASHSVYCCTDNACVADQPGDCTDANVQLIQASSYDQSCQTDSDCVPISEGNACDVLGCCANATISKDALAQYQSDLAKTRVASCSTGNLGCNCAVYNFCCNGGSCQWPCSSPRVVADAGSDASDAGEGGGK
jgi:hypothetical protein